MSFTGPNGKLVVVSSTKISTKGHYLTFIYNVGNGALYYDNGLHKYIYRPLGTATAVYVTQIIANGWEALVHRL